MSNPGLRHLHTIGRTILRPALTLIGALAALATVGAVAAVALPSHSRPRPAANAAPVPEPAAVRDDAAPAATPPDGGLPGEITIDGEGANGNNGYISIDQCTVCAAFNSRKDNDREWLLTTTDGGANWSVKRSRWEFTSPDDDIPPVAWAGKNGWTAAIDQRSKHGDERLLVTHDGGVTWTPTGPTSLASEPSVSVAGGFVWALGLCETVSCQLQRGPASGSRLTDVSAPRGLSNDDELQIAAFSANGVYAYSSEGSPKRAFVTYNDGRSWQRVPNDCSEVNELDVYTDGHGTLWRTCGSVAISTDGGRHWVKRHDPRGSDHTPEPVDALFPVSARIAWASALGDLFRTDDGGRSWHEVLSLPYANIDFDASSATEAQAVGVLRHKDAQGHVLKNLVVYRTTDAGAHWTRTPVTLPSN